MNKYFVLVGLAIVAALFFYLFFPRASPRAVEGAVTIQRLTCEPSEEGSYTVSVAAQNTTNTTFHDLQVELSVAKGEKVTSEEVSLGRKNRGEAIEATSEVAFAEEINVCFAKFFSSDRQVRAVFRP